MIEHGELSPYFRLTSDDRIVVGGGVVRRGAHGSLAPSPGRLRAAVRALAPELSDVDIESAWAGETLSLGRPRALQITSWGVEYRSGGE